MKHKPILIALSMALIISLAMYALEDCDVYSEPDETSDKVDSLSQNEEVVVIGLVPTDHGDWYQLGNDEDEREVIGYVSAGYLVNEKVVVASTSTSSSGQSSGTSASSSSSSSSTSESSNSGSSSSSSSSSAAAAEIEAKLKAAGLDTTGGSITGGEDGSHIASGGSGAGVGVTVY